MKVLLIGSEEDRLKFEEKFGTENTVFLNERDEEEVEVIFHFSQEINKSTLLSYNQLNIPVLYNIPMGSLLSLFKIVDSIDFPCFGFNGLPTFFERSLMEVSCLRKEEEELLKMILNNLGTEYRIVKDQVGMVTPRIIAMIINEAYHTVSEGSATKGDIDLAMKLGTSYPFGPFEWAEMIGIENIYELLEALFSDTHDTRYRTCSELKRIAILK